MTKPLWNLTYSVDKSVTPGSMLKVSGSISNISSRVFQISKFRKDVSWEDDAHYYYKDCSIRVNPEETKELPQGNIPVPVRIDLGSYNVRLGFDMSVLSDEGWEDTVVSKTNSNTVVTVVKAQPIDFTVFISHSNNASDSSLLKKISEMLENCGIDVFVAEKRRQTGEDLWTKIRSGVDQAHCILLLWTDESSESGDVREEIGYAIGKGKKIVTFAETDLIGSLKGKEYIKLDRENLDDSLEEIGTFIFNLTEKK